MGVERLRYAFIDFLVITGGSTAESIFRLELPAIPGLALLIHQVHLDTHEGAAADEYRAYGLTHDLEQAAFSFTDPNMWVDWTVKAARVDGSEGAGGRDRYFAKPYVLVGPQKVVIEAGSNPLTFSRLSLYYTSQKIGMVEWTDLLRRTSIGG